MSSNVTNSGTPLPPAPTSDELPLADRSGHLPGAAVVQGPQGADQPRATGKVFASDEASRNQGPNRLSGEVGNATPYDKDLGALKEVFEQNGVAAPTEAQLRNLQSVADDSAGVRSLVDGVKRFVRDGSGLPPLSSYEDLHASIVDQQRQMQRDNVARSVESTVSKIGKNGDGDEEIAAKIGDPAALVMFVMLKSKAEITQQKKDDLDQIKKYSTINDLMNQHMENVLLPAQQELQEKVSKEKHKDKADKIKVEMPAIENVNKDAYGTDEDGNPKLLSDTGRDKNGAALPDTKSVTQTQLTSEISQFQNEIQMVGSRMQREQTNYSGHDSQDSTLSNIITATNKTFADARSAIINNMK